MSRRVSTPTRLMALVVAAGLVSVACGGSDGAVVDRNEARTPPTTTEQQDDPTRSELVGDSDTGDAPARADDDDPVPADVAGRPINPEAPAEIVSTRDRLARALGVQPAFDAVVLAMARGYDYQQIDSASRADGLQPDGTIFDRGAIVTPAGPPTPGPQGLRAVEPPLIDAGTRTGLLEEMKRWNLSADGTGDPGGGIVSMSVENKEILALEMIIYFAAEGMDINEVIGMVLLGIPPTCESVRLQQYLQHIADKVCEGPIGEQATTTTSTTSTTSPTSTTVSEPAPDSENVAVNADDGADDSGGEAIDDDRTYVGTVQFDLGIGAGTPTVNELFLIATTRGLVGTYRYQASADGFCIGATADLDDAVVVEVAPGQYSGPVSIVATVSDGPCGSGETEVIPFSAQLEGRLEGQQIVGTLDESGQLLPFTATLQDAG